ncbi:MAG TPA: FadR/GntR family transcriptional regulator [Longimicrobiales bacterium]
MADNEVTRFPPYSSGRPPARRFRSRAREDRLSRLNLSDQVAAQVQLRIADGEYRPGDRLPPIRELARIFEVGPPTVREGLKKLEGLGIIVIRPGSGVYVNRADGTSPAAPRAGGANRLLADMVEARIPVEARSAAMAARHATTGDLEIMRRLLAGTGDNSGELPDSTGLAFHRRIGLASGNPVLGQFLEAVGDILPQDQRLLWAIADSRECDHEAHREILEAVEQRDGLRASELMRSHLHSVRGALLEWGSR